MESSIWRRFRTHTSSSVTDEREEERQRRRAKKERRKVNRLEVKMLNCLEKEERNLKKGEVMLYTYSAAGGGEEISHREVLDNMLEQFIP